MSIAPISQASPLAPSYSAQNDQQKRSEFQQLVSSIQSGNLSGAKSAYTSLFPNGVPAGTSNTPIGQDLGALGQALQSGDISSAQQQLTKLQTDFQALRSGGHHHHHHHQAADGTQGSANNPPASGGNPFLSAGVGSTPSGSLINVTA